MEKKESNKKFEALENAVKIREQIERLLLLDFGVKDKIRDTRFYIKAKNMTDEDAEQFKTLVEKYKIVELNEYPEWFIDYARQNILRLITQLTERITEANSIYPVNMTEYEHRRLLQDLAISDCYKLKAELQSIMRQLPIDLSKWERHYNLIQNQIGLLKGWRKSDNSFVKKLQKA